MICTEDLIKSKAVIDCGHFFCLDCITTWAAIENTCPFCKKEFTKIIHKAITKKSDKRRMSASLIIRKSKTTVAPAEIEDDKTSEIVDVINV